MWTELCIKQLNGFVSIGPIKRCKQVSPLSLSALQVLEAPPPPLVVCFWRFTPEESPVFCEYIAHRRM
jgi:hypothetical protein